MGCPLAQAAIAERRFLSNPADLDSPRDMARIATLAEQIAAGLCYLHAANIIHGDLTSGTQPQL